VTIEPYTVDVSDAVLGDLAERVRRTRWPDQIPDTAWEYGTDLDYLRDLCAYWVDGFDWRAAEARLNAWPQGVTQIAGQRIHFIHARAEDPDALPLLVLHGWPGSVAEMLKIIEPLRHPATDGADATQSFHVVCPSLPGFGFSGPTTERGWHPRRIAGVMVELMDRLGYPKFGLLGGDWGATISNFTGLDHPERLYGLYLTMVAAGPPAGSDFSEVTDPEKEWVAANAAFFAEESGYLQIQATRPQTLAYGLNDSPAGLAGWMVEKLRAWSDCGGDLETAISRDEALTNITLYWVTQTANSASRIYLEAMRAGQLEPIPVRIDVPTGAAIFPKETVRSPRAWAERAWDIRRWTVMPRGGHFPALEAPDLLVADVRAFYRGLRSSP
jgi:pimeloyl-ACP methyl ester carboxylesterase